MGLRSARVVISCVIRTPHREETMSETGATIQLVSGSSERDDLGACHPTRADDLCHPTAVAEPEDDERVEREE
jgi:hypothetical protein